MYTTLYPSSPHRPNELWRKTMLANPDLLRMLKEVFLFSIFFIYAAFNCRHPQEILYYQITRE